MNKFRPSRDVTMADYAQALAIDAKTLDPPMSDVEIIRVLKRHFGTEISQEIRPTTVATIDELVKLLNAIDDERKHATRRFNERKFDTTQQKPEFNRFNGNPNNYRPQVQCASRNFDNKSIYKPIVEPVRYSNPNYRNPKDTQRNWQSYGSQQKYNPRITRSGNVQIVEIPTNGLKYTDAKAYQTVSNRDSASKNRNSEPTDKRSLTRYGPNRDAIRNATMLAETVISPTKAAPSKETARERYAPRDKQIAQNKRPLKEKSENELTDWNDIVELGSNMINNTVYINSNMKNDYTLQYSDVLKSGNVYNTNMSNYNNAKNSEASVINKPSIA